MKNKTAIALVQKIQKDLTAKKFGCETIIENLKELRTISIEEKNPVLTKALRLAYEHLENQKAFHIGIPADETSEDESTSFNFSKKNDLESLAYFIALTLDATKPNNLLDLKEYNKAFLAY